MIALAIKMLVGDRMKYISLVLGLAFAALLVTQQASIFNGFAKQTGAWIRDSSVGNLWVMDEQVEFSIDLKYLTDTQLNRVRSVEGVEWAMPVQMSFVNVTLPDGTKRNVRLIGIDDATLTGGPPAMVQGELADLKRDRAVIMNVESAAQLKFKRDPSGRALEVGDHVTINDEHEVRIVGSYTASKDFFWEPIFYTTYSRAVFITPENSRKLTYMLVKTRDHHSQEAVMARINQLPGLKALTNEQFEANTMEWILRETGILVNFGITIVLGFIIGLLASGQTLYQFMVENLRHFGALKAMGAGNGMIARMVIMQVLVAAVIGFGLGLGGACLTGIAFKNVGLAFDMVWQIPVIGGLSIVACCLVGGLVSLVRVIRLEPAVVFRG